MVALPPFFVETFRAKMVGTFMPFWKGVNVLQKPFNNKKQLLEVECKKLEGENQVLRSDIARLKLLFEQMGAIDPHKNEKWSILAHVIYRDPLSWSSAFWVNVGEETNQRIKSKIIVKNSPVLFGRGVVGVVDYVGKNQSRIRLVTDSGLKVSVRATRGLFQNTFLVEQLDLFSRSLANRKDLPLTAEEKSYLMTKFGALKEHLSGHAEGVFLAKGIVQGAGAPLWRKNGILKGFGFNYDFADSEGPARDLVSGATQDSKLPAVPILQVNDLLVTTGMDGIFPANLPVGEVEKVYPLKEGGYFYEIDVNPFVQSIDDLKAVFIIPPLGFTPQKE